MLSHWLDFRSKSSSLRREDDAEREAQRPILSGKIFNGKFMGWTISENVVGSLEARCTINGKDSGNLKQI
jgi:hypothetical protein